MTSLSDGPRLEALRELRRTLAGRLEDSSTPASAVPGLARQLRDVLVELDQLAPAGGTPVDELASRRKKRRANVQDGSEVGEQRGG